MFFKERNQILHKIEMVRNAIHSIGHAYENMDLFLEMTFDLLKKLYSIEKSFLILTELTKNSLVYGDVPDWFTLIYQKVFKTKIKESEKDILTLRKISMEYNHISKEKFPFTKSKSLNPMIEVLEKLKSEFNIFYPIIFQNEIFGFYFGRSESSLKKEDIYILDILSVLFALAVRNSVIRNENKKLRSKTLVESNNSKETIFFDRNLDVKKIQIYDQEYLVASPQMKTILENLEKLKHIQFPLLITGETGTGKEFIAKYYHFISRMNTPFVAINCSAIPESLWESELFGYKKGAFTDAKVDKKGLLEEANKGTVFFDEIAEISLDTQSKLLRLIQEKKFRPIGGTKEILLECNFIFATNKNLLDKIQKNQFREDLYYRISTIHIHLPPLRERIEDMIILLDYFVNKYNQLFNRNLTLDLSLMNYILDFGQNLWKGNIRELENFVIQLFINVNKDYVILNDIINNENLFKMNHFIREIENTTEELLGLASGMQIDFEKIIKNISRKIIIEALTRSEHNKTRAAQLLGISRGKLNYQIRELNINL
ncbi:MAG: sigma 54-interacting transcriptional regulator [Leptonema sp. (in: bacteria)]